ncbi:MAG: hypothetical protein IJQ22_01485 [Bacteroidales bacterium]|nr:hypothetical protein [Bacteroidales bacterium]
MKKHFFTFILFLLPLGAMAQTVDLEKDSLLVNLPYENVLNVLASQVQANAQVAPGMKYKEIKGMYDAKMYVPQSIDPYNKTVSGVVSFFVPGAAQLCMGEIGRGIAFFAGECVLLEIVKSAGEKFTASVITDETGKVTGYKDEQAAKSSAGIFIGGLVADLALCIWSSCDASKMAKIKNMYYQDLYGRRASLDVNFEPYFALTPSAGMSLKMNF